MFARHFRKASREIIAVLSRGYILVTFSVIFDEAVFNVSSYDERVHGVKLQEFVEQPEIYMICMSSSSVDDQAAIIPEARVFIITITALNQ